MNINDVSGQIVDAAMKVHSALGPGLLGGRSRAHHSQELPAIISKHGNPSRKRRHKSQRLPKAIIVGQAQRSRIPPDRLWRRGFPVPFHRQTSSGA